MLWNSFEFNLWRDILNMCSGPPLVRPPILHQICDLSRGMAYIKCMQWEQKIGWNWIGSEQTWIASDNPTTIPSNSLKLLDLYWICFFKQLNMTVVSVFPGLPNNQYEPKPVLRTAAGLWEEHMGLFICMIVLATLCLVIIVLGLICIHCRRSQGYSRDDKVWFGLV